MIKKKLVKILLSIFYIYNRVFMDLRFMIYG